VLLDVPEESFAPLKVLPRMRSHGRPKAARSVGQIDQ
jgi:hypothetical protein